MEQQAKKLVYFKRNVPYTIGVRFHSQDAQGFVLNNIQSWVAVPVEGLKDFKMANKQVIIEGLIVETEEPNVDWVTVNALEIPEIDELLKSYLKLKATVEKVDSLAILGKILERAKEQNKSEKVITLVQDRMNELDVDEGAIIPRGEMQGVS